MQDRTTHNRTLRDATTGGHTAPSGVGSEDLTRPAPQRGWRVVDIVVAAVLAVALGLVFMAWDAISGSLLAWLDKLAPGVAGLGTGIWLLGGVIGGLVIRKPGAALFVELLAALVSVIGSPWGISTLYSGLAQGIGAELAFLAFAYRRFTLPVAMLAGLGAALLEYLVEYRLYYRGYGATFQATYLTCMALSGIVLAGVLGWLITRALAGTGALNRFAAGRR